MANDLLKRITLNLNVCFAKPTIRNMRYPVEMILDLLAAGITFDELLEITPTWSAKTFKCVCCSREIGKS